MVGAVVARLIVLLACVCVAIAAGVDYYKVLGVSKSVGDKELKKACTSALVRCVEPCART